MTARERQKMQRLEIENAELREQVKRQWRVYSDNLIELCELKARFALVDSALHGDDKARET